MARYRDVYIFSTPKTHIHDYFVTTDFDENYENATLNIEAFVTIFENEIPKNYSVRASLFDDKKKQILTEILDKSGQKNSEKNVMSRVEEKDPELAEEIRKLMFVFEDLVYFFK